MTKTAAVVGESMISDRQQWEKTLKKQLASMLKKQKSQIETLLHERYYLEDYLQRQHTQWHSKNQTLKHQISQMRKMHELAKKAQDARLECFLGLKDRVISVLKDQTEKSERNVENFGECLESLVQQISDLNADRGKETHEHEVAKLRSEMQNMEATCKNLISIKDSEITSLLTQKDLLQTQLKQSSSDLHSFKKSQLDENSKSLKKLQSTINDLRKSAIEKDEMIAKLRRDRNLLVNDMNDATNKIAKLESDVEELRACVYEKSELIAKLRRQQQLEQSILPPKSLSRNIKKKHPATSLSDNRYENSSQPRPPESLLQNPKLKSTPVTEKTNKEEASLQTLPRRSARLQSIRLKSCSSSKESTAVSANVTEKTNKEEASLQTLPRHSARLQSRGLKSCSSSKESTAVSSPTNLLFPSTFKVPKLNSRTR
ncbi:hypothetical protein ZOSMA_37G00910 [Zostera marina]|uniref:Uncharacterized protein n=1 Tax=Zostera marina TaxID=29655 RepID=A0A0K9P7S1_ZOSMR|nr:hypothetical protein ZOSMA_37G00910 [Zostera marina]